jgi:fibronectin type 3 domain-containing protein
VTYGYYVAADNSAGQGASSATVYAAPGDTASAAPTGLAASVSGTTSAVLAWNTVTGATSYNVYRATTSGGEGSDPIATGVYSGSYTNTGLSTSTTYYYEVTAVNTAGESSKSNEASMTTGSTSLGGPGSFTATPGNAQVSLSWSTVTGASGYNLCRNVAGGGFSLYQLGLSTNSYTDTGVTNGISYGYYVAAVDSAGQGTHSSTAYATPSGAVPAAPYGLAATPSGATAVALTWVAVPGAATYNIYRATTSGGEGATPVVTGVTADVYTNSGLSISTAYYYQVTAVNSIGESSKSAEATATTGATAPSAPSAISADPGNGVVTLNWSASTGATSYNLNRNVAGGNTTLYQSGLTTNTYSDTGITNGISYGYSVNAVNSSGQGSPSGYAYAVPGDTAPAAPTGLTASPSGTTAIALTWNAVLGATTYDIYRSTTSGGEGSTPVVTGISSTSYTNSGLTTSTAYYYEVTAVSSAGEGAKSNEASATTGGTALGAPTGLTATPSSGQIALSWTAVSGASRYNLYRSLVAYGSFTAYQIGLTTTSYTDTNVTNGVTYYYYVAAVSSAGSGTNSSTVSATPGDTAPAAPANLTASSSSSTSIALSWTASPGASSYNVFIGTASGAEGATPIATLITNTTYTSTGLTSGTAYYYKVSAVNTAGESGKSNEATAVPGGTVLPAPVAVTAVATSGQVVVNWSSVSGASTYNLYRNVESGTFALYELGLTTTTLTDTAVTNGVTYGYEIAANDSAGLGAISSAAYATPGYVPPAAPTDLTATSFGTTQPTEIQLSWNAVPEATSYNLYRSTTSGGEGSVPVKIGIPIQTGVLLMDNYNDTGLASATTYYYKVTAVTSAGEGPQSNEAHATDGTTVLAAPNIEVTAGSAQVSVEWSSVTGAATYNLYRNVQGAAFVLYQAGLTATNFTDTGLTNGVTYGYYVCAVSSAGVGTASATVYGTPGDSALPAPTGLTAVGTTASPFEVTLAWNSVPAATSYNIYRGTYSGGEGSAPYFNAALRTDTNVSQNTEYFYQITAVGPAGESPRSNEAEAIVGGTISTGFDLFLYPGAVTVARSANGSVAVQVPAASNFSGPVNLTLSGVPAGVTGFCYGPSITVDPTTHFGEGFDVWFNVSSSATPGTYLITLTGTAGAAASYSYADTVTIALTVD